MRAKRVGKEDRVLTVYGADWCEDTQRSLRYLRRLGIAYEYRNVDADPVALDEAKALNVPSAVMSAVLDQWETTNAEYGGDSDFTAIVKMIEKRAGVTVGTEKKR